MQNEKILKKIYIRKFQGEKWNKILEPFKTHKDPESYKRNIK